MASTYSTNLRVELMADGENSNTWGSKANTNLTLLEQAVSGVASVTMTDADYTLTTSNAATDEARNMVVTMIGTISQARNVIVPSVDKVYVIKNSTTGGFAITVKTSGGTGVTIPNGATIQLYCDATNVEVSSTVAGKINFTQPANGATFTLLDGKTLTVNHSLTLAGTDSTVMTFPATSASVARIDAAQTFVGTQTFSGLINANLGLTVAGAAFNSRGITDNATAKALTLSGSGANSVTIANSATNPTIGTSAGAVSFNPAGQGETLRVTTGGASTVNYFSLSGATTGGRLTLLATGSDTNVGASWQTKGSGSHLFVTETGASAQVEITHTASANRYITLTGSSGGNPTIGTSAGSLAISCPVVVSPGTGNTFQILDGFLDVAGRAQVLSGIALPAGGGTGVVISATTSNIGIYFGSGAPTVSAAKGSLYLRSDGTTTNNRMYVNTNGGTTWTAVTTAA